MKGWCGVVVVQLGVEVCVVGGLKGFSFILASSHFEHFVKK